MEEIRPTTSFDVSCQGTVHEVIIAFLEPESFEDTLLNAVSRGDDSETLACITGEITQASDKEIPDEIATAVRARLSMEFIQVSDQIQLAFSL